jgi:hypothetical protein
MLVGVASASPATDASIEEAAIQSQCDIEFVPSTNQ